jgi:hypothetical protein
MKFIYTALLISCLAMACKTEKQPPLPIQGTWQLLTATIVDNNDSVVTDYTKGRKFIKIINDSHFSFLHHDLTKGIDSPAVFSAGGGSYTLKDSTYTEHLEFCNDRAWERNNFSFIVTIHNDTLIQKGIEKVEGTNINRLNMETYVRTKTVVN